MQEVFLRQALELAAEAGRQGEVPVGAVLVCDQKVIGRGANRREATGKTTAHAEIQALEDYSSQTGQWRVPVGSALYVTVEPCLMCTGALLWARVDAIFFGCRDPRSAGLLKIQPLIDAGVFDHRFTSINPDIESGACAELIQEFFKKKRRLSGE